MKTVILAAGFGSRLWPLSTPELPKQFLPLLHDDSLLQVTYHRLERHTDAAELYVLTLAGLESHVREQLPDLAPTQIISVPARRNILPHTLFALNWLHAEAAEPVFFAAVDYHTSDEAQLDASLAQFIKKYGLRTSLSDIILLCDQLNISAHKGYVQIDSAGKVQAYAETPTTKGNWLRFPCLFIVSKAAMHTALQAMPDHKLAVQATQLLESDKQRLIARHKAMPFVGTIFAFPTNSHHFVCAPNVKAHAANLGLTDIGTFRAIYDMSPKDEQGNVVLGKVVCRDNANSLLINQSSQPLIATNIRHAVIVQTAAGMLACPLDQAEKIGPLYKQMFSLPQ